MAFFFARYQGLQVIVEKIMTVCLPASSVSHGLHITNSLSATQSLIKEAVGLPFKADSTYPASHQWPSGSSISNEQLVFNCLTQGL